MSTGSPQVILIICSYFSYHNSITLVVYDQQKRAVHLHSKFIEFVVFYYFFFVFRSNQMFHEHHISNFDTISKYSCWTTTKISKKMKPQEEKFQLKRRTKF